MIKDFLRGIVGNQIQTNESAGYINTPDLSQFAVADGATYIPPLTVPSEWVDYLTNADPAAKAQFDVKLKEAQAPFQAQFATPYAQGAPFYELAMSTVLFPMMEWNWQSRRYIIEQCHLAWERNPMAKQAVRYNRLFSVQDGMMRAYRCAEVEKVLEDFCNDPMNAVNELEKSFIEALCMDGELFIRYSSSGGRTVISPLRPWYIQWIRANPDNFREVYSYRYSGSIVTDSGLDFDTFVEDVPADEIDHFAINRLPYEQRGRPELFSILPYLEAYKRWLQDRARQNAFRGAVYDITLKNATPGQVSAKRSQYSKPMMAGTITIHNDMEEHKVQEQLVGATDASEDGRQIKLQVAVGMGLPEYMMADGSNANLASATAQALPALKTFGEWQDIATDIWTKIFKRVIREAVAAGVLDEMVIEERLDGEPVIDPETNKPSMIKAEDAFDITYGDLEGMDKTLTVQALLSIMNAGLMSEKTATGLMPWPLDYDVEQTRIDAEKQKSMDDMMAGRTPMPPGINPATGAPGQPLLPPDEKAGKGMTMGPEMTQDTGEDTADNEDNSNG